MQAYLLKIIISFLIAVYIFLKICVAINDLFKTTPVGETKEWIWTFPTGYGFAITFTNIDNKNGSWQCGFFRISRRK